jgi:hypothetical protein
MYIGYLIAVVTQLNDSVEEQLPNGGYSILFELLTNSQYSPHGLTKNNYSRRKTRLWAELTAEMNII